MVEIMDEERYVSDEEAVWQVTDDQAAEWCLSKIREAQDETEKWKAYYDDQLQKINNREDSRIAFFEEKLKEYFYKVPHKMTKTQSSYKLPSGKLVMKGQEPAYERDEEQLLAWLRQNHQERFVKTKETVDWSGLKKSLEGAEGLAISNGRVITPDGEIVPGITVVERPNIFKVEVK